jgi:hypothetical protein
MSLPHLQRTTETRQYYHIDLTEDEFDTLRDILAKAPGNEA